jgi:hypothetical protein
VSKLLHAARLHAGAEQPVGQPVQGPLAGRSKREVIRADSNSLVVFLNGERQGESAFLTG